MLEKALKIRLIDWLNRQHYIWFYKVDDRTHPGIPDIVGCKNGLFFAIEIKRPGKHKVRKLQEFNIQRINKVRGYGLISDDYTEIINFINLI